MEPIVNTTVPAVHNSKLHEFFREQLQDMYWAEQKLVRSLPKLEAAATSERLKEAFRNHTAQTKVHVSRLQSVFELIGEPVASKKCPAMAGIMDEAQDVMDETDEGTAQRDVALIFAGQKAEHYEIATYGGLVSLARVLGYTEAGALLAKTLAEEKEADVELTLIAENNINYKAAKEER